MEGNHDLGRKGWYVLKVLSGAEASISNQIKLSYEAAGLFDSFEGVYCPSVEVQFGKKLRRKILYPGYIFVKMILNEKTRDVIDSIPKIYSFLSDSPGKPKMLTDKEYQEMVDKISMAHKSNIEGQSFAINDLVKIKSGSFNEFKGTVLAVDKEKKLLTLLIVVFQRETQITVAFDDAEKLN